jgi:ATP-dependent protease HslVU (ClpYQ) peptidase subunit
LFFRQQTTAGKFKMKTKKKQNYRRTLGDVLGHCAGSIDYYFPFLQQRKKKKRKEQDSTKEKEEKHFQQKKKKTQKRNFQFLILFFFFDFLFSFDRDHLAVTEMRLLV